MLGLIVTIIIVGLIAGALARLLVPGRQDISIPMTILLGIVGSFVGGFLLVESSGLLGRSPVTPTTAVATVLAAIVTAAILGSDIGETGVRILGVVAIIDVLGTIVTIALAVFGDSPNRTPISGPLQVELGADLAERLRRRAAETARPASDLAAEAVESWLAASTDHPR